MEDFESGVFGENWTFSQNNAWTIVDNGSKGKCAKSTNAGLSYTDYSMTLTVDVLAPGELTFMYKVSSEQNYDKLFFYMDNQEKGNWSGTVDWAQFTQPVSAGTHTFRWNYHKDGSVDNGDDCAMVDDILFPPTSVITFLEPVADLIADVDDTEVTLTWIESSDADSYIVKRDGEEIARVTETTFTEFVAYGEYEYSVIAAKEDGSISVPVSIVVDVIDYTSVVNNTLSFQVYPNPASSALYIKGIDSTYRYALYNNMGQQVVNGQAQGLKQIDVNSLAKGVYFLRITNGAQTSVQKVVVE